MFATTTAVRIVLESLTAGADIYIYIFHGNFDQFFPSRMISYLKYILSI